jgi:hypothetical protein
LDLGRVRSCRGLQNNSYIGETNKENEQNHAKSSKILICLSCEICG